MKREAFGKIARLEAFGVLAILTLPASTLRAAAQPILPLAHIEQLDGRVTAAPIPTARWKQALFELSRADLEMPVYPAFDALLKSARSAAERGLIPVAILDVEYEPSALSQTSRSPKQRAFSATALRAWTHRGEDVAFAFRSDWYATNDSRKPPPQLSVDFDDGHGWRTIHLDEQPHIHYAQTGRKTIQLRSIGSDSNPLLAAFPFDVLHLGTPSPDDTLHVTGSTPYLGTVATANAYIYLAPGHATLTNPLVAIEGFDLDNTMDWDELYQELNAQGLVETLRAQGFDAVVVDFTDATDYIQRNAFVVTELLQEIEAIIAPNADMAVVGASMGGLVGRYALAYLESHGDPARVRTFISFDSPQRGANIPLGIQYWVQFFADQSAEAAFLRDRLNTPAARQMLVYHFTNPPSGTAASDPLRAQLNADLASVGNYPSLPRLVAMANGSGNRTGQGFAPAEQVVRYEYSSFAVDLTGNVWAVPNGGSATIFRGIIDYFFPPPDVQTTVVVSGTAPYDNAPGGRRSSMADMDAVQAPFGDIVALYPAHCFIPTTSALDLDTTDLFYDIAGDPALLSHTPFDAVYSPMENQDHVAITPENAAWLLAEIPPPATSTPDVVQRAPLAARLYPNVPNPFNPSTRIEFELPHAGPAEIAIHDMSGRLVTTLWRGERQAGRHHVMWDGRTDSGTRASSGVYVCTLQTPFGRDARRLVLVE